MRTENLLTNKNNTMKNKIKEVHDYFKNKVISGDYEVINNKYHTMQILIDSEYPFSLWMANKGYSFGVYSGESNTMELKFEKEEAEKAYKVADIIHAKYKRNVLLAIKKRELEELERELS